MASQQGHKPTMTEKVKEKVTHLKEKISGHKQHRPSGTAPTTTPPATMYGESKLDKAKDKLPGRHETPAYDPSRYESQQGTNGYGTTGYDRTAGYGGHSTGE